MKSYNRDNLPIAQSLRKNMTDWERHLWYDFLCEYPIKFRKQKPLGNYIVDFYCAKAKLVVELDGKVHWLPQVGKKDVLRQKELEQMGYRVIRFMNTELNENFDKVCECIHIEVMKRLNGQ